MLTIISCNDDKELSNTTGLSSHYIGEQFGGGVIFHLWKDNAGVEHGLIVALTDQKSLWSNVNCDNSTSFWDGLSNSNAIVAQAGHTNSAASLCLNLVIGGQSDWYLPSNDELYYLWHNRFNINKTLATISGATVLLGTFWSSTCAIGRDPYYSSGGGFYTDDNDRIKYVRAIRSF